MKEGEERGVSAARQKLYCLIWMYTLVTYTKPCTLCVFISLSILLVNTETPSLSFLLKLSCLPLVYIRLGSEKREREMSNIPFCYKQFELEVQLAVVSKESNLMDSYFVLLQVL